MSDEQRMDLLTDQSITTGDKVVGLTSADLPRRFPLGTAASSDITTSSTDTTAGRVTKVGDFGLGSDITTDLGTITDIANLSSFINVNVSGWQGFITASGVAGMPNAVYSVFVWSRSLRGKAFFITNNNENVYFTSQFGAGWQPIRELYHTGNYPSDTAWTTTTTLLNGWTGTVRYIKRAGMVTITATLDGSAKTSNTVLSLPSAYLPSVQVTTIALDGTAVAATNINNDAVNSLSCSATNAAVRITVSYPVIT